MMTDVRTDAPVIVELRTFEELEAAIELLWTVWKARSRAARSEVISLSYLRCLTHTRNYVAGAYRDKKLVGCCVGFYGEDGAGHYLYSHISGVAPGQQNRGVGFALKAHQRRWALQRGISAIRWTFDPLVRRNAYFNLCKLGASVTGYELDFYGRVDDGINTGESTDRLLVEWSLRSQEVEHAMAGIPRDVGAGDVSAPDARLIAVPQNIEKLREAEPERARALRYSVRREFQDLLGGGYRVAGLSGDGHYVLVPATGPGAAPGPGTARP